MLSVVFLEMTSTLYSFSRVSVKYLSVNNHSVLVVLSSKKDVLFGDVREWPDQLQTKTVT